MRFVRVFIDIATNKVCHVMEQDRPFEGDQGQVRATGLTFEVVDLGAVEPAEWRHLDGRPASCARHIWERIPKVRDRMHEIHAHPEVPRIHDTPCTIEGIRQRVRERGPMSLHGRVRGWLANMLPPHQAIELGIANVPISVIKAAEAMRNRMDPQGGSKMGALMREIDRRAGELRTQIEAEAQAKLEREAAAALKRKQDEEGT